jgi:hypothetical protein
MRATASILGYYWAISRAFILAYKGSLSLPLTHTSYIHNKFLYIRAFAIVPGIKTWLREREREYTELMLLFNIYIHIHGAYHSSQAIRSKNGRSPIPFCHTRLAFADGHRTASHFADYTHFTNFFAQFRFILLISHSRLLLILLSRQPNEAYIISITFITLKGDRELNSFRYWWFNIDINARYLHLT